MPKKKKRLSADEKLEIAAELAEIATVLHCDQLGIRVWRRDGEDEVFTDAAQDVFNTINDEFEAAMAAW